MNVELLMQYATYVMIAIGALAFLVAAIVQVIKELPWLQRIQTSLVAFVVSLVLCPLAVVIVCQYLGIAVTLYYIIASIIAALNILIYCPCCCSSVT